MVEDACTKCGLAKIGHRSGSCSARASPSGAVRVSSVTVNPHSEKSVTLDSSSPRGTQAKNRLGAERLAVSSSLYVLKNASTSGWVSYER